MQDIERKLQEQVTEMLRDGKVAVVIGWGKGWNPAKTAPVFIRDPETAHELLFNNFCNNNLAVYLPRLTEKAAIITKPCEKNSVIALLAEGKIAREAIVIIGVGCDAVIDPHKLEQVLGSLDDIVAAKVEGDELIVELKNETKHMPLASVAMDKCAGCTQDMSECDITIGEASRKLEVSDAIEIPEDADAAWWREFWVKEFDRCLRCYACREACPACYCRDNCAVQSLRERWTGATVSPEEALMFHAQRAMHVAGRCTECGACERACPVNIPLTLLHKQVGEAVRKLFGFNVGEKADERPPLETFRKEEL